MYELITELTDFIIPRADHFDRATITTIIDAETREALSGDIDAPPGAFQSNRGNALPPCEAMEKRVRGISSIGCCLLVFTY